MNRRKIKLIQPRLQLTLVGWFLAVAVTGLVLQVLLLGSFLAELASTLPDEGAAVAASADGMLVEALLVSLLFLVPMTVGVGILATFRIAGPIYRFETYLGQVARGEEVGPCELRRGDQLQGLCEKINEALAAARSAKDAGEGEDRLERHRRDAA
jgi:hypothetical protein